MKDKTGGPAFPRNILDHGHGTLTIHESGMSLRDYFAAQAMPAVYSDYCESARTIGFDENWKMGIALGAYKIADAMLAARNAK